MQYWILFAVINALIMGLFECFRKKAVEKNTIFEIIAMVYLICFAIVVVFTKNAFNIEPKYIAMIFIKSIILIIAWLGVLYSLKHLSIGIYSMINTSRILFTVILSAIVLGETITPTVFLGMVIIIAGIILANNIVKNRQQIASLKVFLILIISCLCNAVSAILDKYLLAYVTCGQIMYWVFLFMTLISWLILLIKQRHVNIKGLCKNKWVLLTAFSLVIADFFLMKANEDINSKAAIISLIKQLIVVETIILGKFFFGEKETFKKLAYSFLIIFGIILTII